MIMNTGRFCVLKVNWPIIVLMNFMLNCELKGYSVHGTVSSFFLILVFNLCILFLKS